MHMNCFVLVSVDSRLGGVLYVVVEVFEVELEEDFGTLVSYLSLKLTSSYKYNCGEIP